MNTEQSYNVALIGNGGVGKTSLLNAIDGKFEMRYNNTSGVDKKSVLFNTTQGLIKLKIFDYAGQEQYAGRDSNGADLSVIMYDLTNKLSHKMAHTFWKNFAGNSPTLYVANKNDIKDQWVNTTDIKISCRKDPKSVRILMQTILRKLTNDSQLEILDEVKDIVVIPIPPSNHYDE
jgi:small GTP-binding protein